MPRAYLKGFRFQGDLEVSSLRLRMKISIITVCYNAEKTIADAMESVLRQKPQNGLFDCSDCSDCSIDGCYGDIRFVREGVEKVERVERSFVIMKKMLEEDY